MSNIAGEPGCHICCCVPANTEENRAIVKIAKEYKLSMDFENFDGYRVLIITCDRGVYGLTADSRFIINQKDWGGVLTVPEFVLAMITGKYPKSSIDIPLKSGEYTVSVYPGRKIKVGCQSISFQEVEAIIRAWKS
jgi:hypothetical protein